MTITLVLGATGTVGTPLTHLLVDAGHTVRAATRTPAEYVGAGTATFLDVQDPSTFAAALDGVDRLFVMAPPGHADAFALLHSFVDYALPKVERIVTMTAQGVQYDESIPFRKLELFIESAGVPYVHLRPSWFSQNFHTFWGHGVREADRLALPAEDASVGFIDARDIAASAAGALTRDDIALESAYELTGPEAWTHSGAAAELSKVIGRELTYTSISDDAFREQLAPSGLPSDYIELLVSLFAAVRAGSASNVTEHVQYLSGSAPRTVAAYAKDYRSALG
ncbi:MAG: NAD(P)H-binding protein [Polyangiales bacterium]